MRISLAAVAVCLIPAAALAVDMPSLEQAYTATLQSVKPHAAALAKSVRIQAKAKATQPAPKVKRFNLDFEGGRWHLRPDPNPPGSGLQIDVYQGDRVRLELVNASWNGVAQFLIDGIDATVNGKPSHGIDVWLPSTGDSAVVEFDATQPGIHPINRSTSVGLLLIRSR